MDLWPDPYSCSHVKHFVRSLVSPGVVSIRLIVEMRLVSLTNVITLLRCERESIVLGNQVY
jgi:hypothetical protein